MNAPQHEVVMKNQWHQWVTETFSNIAWPHILLAIAAFAATWLVLTGLFRFVKTWLPRWTAHFNPHLEALAGELFAAVRPVFFPIYALAVGLSALDLEPGAKRAISFVVVFALLYQLMLIANRVIDDLFYQFSSNKINGRITANAKSNLIAGAKVGLWLLAILIVLDNFGINVSMFVAGLGIGGIAVALAAQAILGDTFGSFTITLDKPFVPGDYISFGTDEGRVESVGLKTTRIRGLGGEAIVVPNSELTRARLKNFADMRERRGVLRQSISDTTPLSLLEKIPSLMRDVLAKIIGVRVSRIHLVGTAPQAFVLEIEWFSDGPSYSDFLDRQQEAYLSLYKMFDDAKIAGPSPEKLLITPELQHSLELH